MNVDKFFDLYKELDLTVKSVYNLDNADSVAYFLSHNHDYVHYENEIRYMADIRNLLAHNPKIGGNYVVDVSDETITFLEKLIDKIKNRKKLKDIMVPVTKINFAYKTTLVKDVIASLSDKIYNHVPIKDGNKIIGVFDEVSLFNMVKDKVEVSSDVRFEEILEYTDISRSGREVYLDAEEDMYVDDLRKIFNDLYKQGKRIGLVFVKDYEGNLAGIISTTDILGK